MDGPWFIAIERCRPGSRNGERFAAQVNFTGLTQVKEFITIDRMVCPSVISTVKDAHWPHIVNEDDCLHMFTNLEVLRRWMKAETATDPLVLCVYRHPDGRPILPAELHEFRFVGFDLIGASASALVNCGGWPELDKDDLNQWGLIEDHGRVLELQHVLCLTYPDDWHADCDVWAIFAHLH